MTVQAKLETALRHAQPYEELRHVALELASQGQTQQQVYDTFEQFRVQLRDMARETDEDILMGVMDCICGWCSPQAKLFD